MDLPAALIDNIVSLALYGPYEAMDAWFAEGGFWWDRVLDPQSSDDYWVVVDTPTDPTHLSGQAMADMLLRDAGDHREHRFRATVGPTIPEAFQQLAQFEAEADNGVQWRSSQSARAFTALRVELGRVLAGDTSDHTVRVRYRTALPSLCTEVVATRKSPRWAGHFRKPDRGVYVVSRVLLRRHGLTASKLSFVTQHAPLGRGVTAIIADDDHPLLQHAQRFWNHDPTVGR
jgi:hypothetical protein